MGKRKEEEERGNRLEITSGKTHEWERERERERGREEMVKGM